MMCLHENTSTATAVCKTDNATALTPFEILPLVDLGQTCYFDGILMCSIVG